MFVYFLTESYSLCTDRWPVEVEVFQTLKFHIKCYYYIQVIKHKPIIVSIVPRFHACP